jgi:hypothetical protein
LSANANPDDSTHANAAEKFDAHGHLTDDKAKELIGRLLATCELAARGKRV